MLTVINKCEFKKGDRSIASRPVVLGRAYVTFCTFAVGASFSLSEAAYATDLDFDFLAYTEHCMCTFSVVFRSRS